MFPTVAPFPSVQPHHHIHHYLTQDAIHQQTYDLNDSNLPAYNDLYKTPSDLPSRARLQLPHPVQRLDARDPSGSTSKTTPNAEHALRRKTPNGTLAAGYDGTPGDTTIQPAPKHILVSPLESGQFLSPQAGLQPENWQHPPVDPSTTKQMNFPPVFKNDAGNAIAAGELVQDVNGTSWVRPVNYPPGGFDSLLNQSLPLQTPQRFFVHNGAYVPTVLPATLQQCVGPTASAGTGPFGPYWPDGVYIPYRPAAFRDSRFGSPNPNLFDANQPVLNQVHVPVNGRADSTFAWSQPTPGIPHPDPLFKPHFPPRHSDQSPYHVRPNRSISYANPFKHDPMSWTGRPPGPSYHPPGPTVAANTEFKEKVLTWAHGVYVDLLATIHQARRKSVSNGGADGQNPRFLKPTIYPKPPRQPGLDFSQHTTPNLRRHNSYSYNQHDLQRRKFGGMASSNFSISGNVAGRRPSLNQFSHIHRASDTQMLEAGPFPGGATLRLSGSFFNEGSPVANASSALEMLSHLCMESRWEWIDGMLLGGCLAYGLGDYNKAMRWYSRIIARDST